MECSYYQLFFKPLELPKLEVVTKRLILSLSSRLFDPCGLLAPISIRAKLLMQDLWKLEKCSWDTPLEQPLVQRWIDIMLDLEKASTLKIKRCISENLSINDKPLKLYGFCDSSPLAYGASVYLAESHLH